MLVKVAALIDEKRTVVDIVHELRENIQSQDIFHVLHILSDWNLIVRDDFDLQTVVHWQRTASANQLRFLCETCEPFLQSLVSIDPFDDFPVFSYAVIATPPVNGSQLNANGVGEQKIYTAGTGFCQQAGVLAALGELAETIGVNWTAGVKTTRATVKQLGPKCIHPRKLMLFSERQYESRERWLRRYGKRHQVPFPVHSDVPLDWVTVTSYPHEKQFFIPAGFGYLNYPHDRDYLVADSNGCATGLTRNEATVAGFLELVERDAVAIWWYNGIIRPAIDMESFNDPELDECVDWMKRHNRLFYALDLTHDYDIPVIAALSVNSETTDIAIGFGANFGYLSALKSAVREMLQVYALKKIIERQMAADGAETLDQSARDFVDWANGNFVKRQPHMRPGGKRKLTAGLQSRMRPGDSTTRLPLCEALCRQKKQQLFTLDVTQPSFKVSVVRTIVPGMRHFRARFAPGRLYEVPVAIGWLSAHTSENDLTERPIPI